MNCPNCGASVSGEVCKSCKVIVSEYNKKLERCEKELTELKAELSNVKLTDYMNFTMGKWITCR